MTTSLKNLSIEEQGKRIRKWIESHLKNKEDIACFDGFVKKVAYASYQKGYNVGHYEGYESAKHEMEIGQEIEEALSAETIEFEE